jgi:hypothetical protein
MPKLTKTMQQQRGYKGILSIVLPALTFSAVSAATVRVLWQGLNAGTPRPCVAWCLIANQKS